MFTRVIQITSTLAILAAILPSASLHATRDGGKPAGQAASRKSSASIRLPVRFEAAPSVSRGDFLARGAGSTVLVGADRILWNAGPIGGNGGIQMTLVGATRAVHARPFGSVAYSNYLTGSDARRWRTRVPTFDDVVYRRVYPRIDVVYHGDDGRLEYDFRVAPRGNPGAIRLRFDGATHVDVDSRGELIVRSQAGEMRHQRPRAYEETPEGNRPVEAAYVVLAANEIGFRVGRHDPSRTLVIDPAIAYASFFGGGGESRGGAIAVFTDQTTGKRYTYVAGTTRDTNLPVQAAVQPALASGSDVFIAKFDVSASGADSLIWATYLGGHGDDGATGVAVDRSGNVFVVGAAGSTDFPFAHGVQAHGGAFLAKLDASGSQLMYSTQLGGSVRGDAHAVAVDAAGFAYVAGDTGSMDFPVTANAFQTTPDGNGDAFVAKIDPAQSGAASLVYSTYLGGNRTTRAFAVAVDAVGHVFVTGPTWASTFPIVRGAQATFAGPNDGVYSTSDVFLAEIDPDVPGRAGLLYSTYLGGGGNDFATGVALDAAGMVYIAGNAQAGFPHTGGDFSDVDGGFAAKIDPSQTGTASLIYSRLVPSNSNGSEGIVTGIAVDGSGRAFVTGATNSGLFPTVNPAQTLNAGVFQTIDTGNRWALLGNGMTDRRIYGLAIDRSTSPRTLYAATRFGGVFKSTDGGLNWRPVNTGLTSLGPPGSAFDQSQTIAIDQVHPATVVVSTGAGVFRSTDGGVAWSASDAGLSANSAVRILLDDSSGATSRMFAGSTDGLFRSDDGAASWVSLASPADIFDIAVDPTTTPHGLYVVAGDSLWSSADDGATWMRISTYPFPLPDAVTSVAIDPRTTPATLYVADAQAVESGVEPIWRSADTGVTWTSLNLRSSLGPSLQENPYKLRIDSSTTPSTLYAANQGGVFASADGGTSWTLQIPADVKTLELDAAGTAPAVLYAGTGLYVPPDAFVVQLSTDASALEFSTLLGGFAYDAAQAIALDEQGNVYVTGSTRSANFPALHGFQPDFAGGTAALLVELGPVPTSAPSGCASNCGASAVAIGPTGTVTIDFPGITQSGFTTVTPLSSADTAAFQLSNNLGAYDIATTAGYTASTSSPVTVCFSALTVNDESTFALLRIYHVEAGVPVDVTSTRDYANRVVCGSVTSLSPFVLVRGPQALFSASALTFPSESIGKASPASVVTVTNPGGAPLRISSIAATGDFAQTNTCGVVAPGGACAVSVTFQPTAGGPRSGTLTVADDAPGGAQSVALSGTGLYEFGGFAPPLLPNGSTSIQQRGGRTIPVKFQLFAAGQPAGDATAGISLFRLADVATGTVDMTDLTGEAGAANGGTTSFRYDAAQQQYVYNLSTAGLRAPATYRIVVAVSDGTRRSIDFSLR